jgi:hypothetical protein
MKKNPTILCLEPLNDVQTWNQKNWRWEVEWVCYKTGRTASIPSTKVLNLPRIVAVRLRTPMTMVVVVVVVASTWKGGVKERV